MSSFQTLGANTTTLLTVTVLSLVAGTTCAQSNYTMMGDVRSLEKDG